MNRDFYIEHENWYGSYYELAIELQSSHDNIRLEQALQALWSHPNLSGHWLSKENYEQSPDIFNVADKFHDLDKNSLIHLYGLFFMPEIDKQVGCLSIIVREKDGSDWLEFCFPTEMLKSVFPLKKPFTHDENPWLAILDKYLLQMADIVYQQTRYELAFIGNEVSGLVNKASIISTGIEDQIKIFSINDSDTLLSPSCNLLVSPSFWDEILLNRTYEVMPSGLRWTKFA